MIVRRAETAEKNPLSLFTGGALDWEKNKNPLSLDEEISSLFQKTTSVFSSRYPSLKVMSEEKLRKKIDPIVACLKRDDLEKAVELFLAPYEGIGSYSDSSNPASAVRTLPNKMAELLVAASLIGKKINHPNFDEKKAKNIEKLLLNPSNQNFISQYIESFFLKYIFANLADFYKKQGNESEAARLQKESDSIVFDRAADPVFLGSIHAAFLALSLVDLNIAFSIGLLSSARWFFPMFKKVENWAPLLTATIGSALGANGLASFQIGVGTSIALRMSESLRKIAASPITWIASAYGYLAAVHSPIQWGLIGAAHTTLASSSTARKTVLAFCSLFDPKPIVQGVGRLVGQASSKCFSWLQTGLSKIDQGLDILCLKKSKKRVENLHQMEINKKGFLL